MTTRAVRPPGSSASVIEAPPAQSPVSQACFPIARVQSRMALMRAGVRLREVGCASDSSNSVRGRILNS